MPEINHSLSGWSQILYIGGSPNNIVGKPPRVAMSSGRVVLSFHDSLLLREEDVLLLSGPHWLNDKIIGFFFELVRTVWLAHWSGTELCSAS